MFAPQNSRGVRQRRNLHRRASQWLDNFAMRDFTNDAIFDDTLPVADGLMEIGSRVPIDLLQDRLIDWSRRKGYLGAGGALRLTEL